MSTRDIVPEFGGDWNPITGAKLAGAVEFGATVDSRAVVRGATEANGSVEIRRGETVIGSGTADANGDYSIAIAAPDKAGDDELTVALVEGDADKKTIKVTAAYGAGVAITGPADNADVMGPVTVTGTAQAGSTTTVKVGGGAAESVTVSANGQWSKDVTVPRGETKIVATSKSKGANTTTQTITLNPGDESVELTAAGRFDAQDETRPATAFGAAATGETVILQNAAGVEIGRTVAVDDAYEIVIDPKKAQGGLNTFRVVIAGAESDVKTFTLDYGQAANVVVTSPEKNGTVEEGVVQFRGSGAAGSKVVLRGSSREVARGTVNAQGSWSADSTMALPKASYDLYVDQITKGGVTNTVRHAFKVGTVTPPIAQHTVTSPTSGATVETLRPTFEGTGQNGATITVRGSSRTLGEATVTNGAWKVETGFDLDPGTYNLYVDQSIRGTLVGTIRAEFTVSADAFRELTLTSPAQDEVVTTVRPTFVGTATPGAEIRVGSSRRTVATATVAADGTWRATADFDLERGGTYAGLEVKQTTKSGKTSTVSSTFKVDRNAQ